jgi:toxin FitB
MTLLVADTSVAVPFVMAGHEHHRAVLDVIGDRALSLAAHSAIETYSVLTRLPGDARHDPDDARRLVDESFAAIVVPSTELSAELVGRLAALRIAGGVAYDAVIALTVREVDGTLATRDARAADTYRRVGVAVEVIG